VELQDLVYGGVSLAALVYVVVNQAKHVGLSSKWAGVMAMFVGTLFVGLYNASTIWPVIQPVVHTLVLGISVGAIAMGLHGSNGVKKDGSGGA
jgi:hypothetical protein